MTANQLGFLPGGDENVLELVTVISQHHNSTGKHCILSKGGVHGLYITSHFLKQTHS